jgi:hypothetical protein
LGDRQEVLLVRAATVEDEDGRKGALGVGPWLDRDVFEREGSTGFRHAPNQAGSAFEPLAIDASNRRPTDQFFQPLK